MDSTYGQQGGQQQYQAPQGQKAINYHRVIGYQPTTMARTLRGASNSNPNQQQPQQQYNQYQQPQQQYNQYQQPSYPNAPSPGQQKSTFSPLTTAIFPILPSTTRRISTPHPSIPVPVGSHPSSLPQPPPHPHNPSTYYTFSFHPSLPISHFFTHATGNNNGWGNAEVENYTSSPANSFISSPPNLILGTLIPKPPRSLPNATPARVSLSHQKLSRPVAVSRPVVTHASPVPSASGPPSGSSPTNPSSGLMTAKSTSPNPGWAPKKPLL
ncbi:hypothetical protein ABVK25_011973 [Lepraria finkii]|uniref:Uncharacterized protein n=1 Tax=Lepraria finkii TaxID=1340010 RepID=A0ABR4AKZ8_9LECA